jgi:5-methylcytosine-specific restriction enzyme A
MALARACLGCGRLVRGASRCQRCQRDRERAKSARRPEYKTAAETRRRREAVAAHRAQVGDWCPGVPELHRPAHPSAKLTADHVVEVAAGGPEGGPLVVRCGPCNSARSANVTRRALAELGVSPKGDDPTTPCPPKFPTHTGDDGPAVA